MLVLTLVSFCLAIPVAWSSRDPASRRVLLVANGALLPGVLLALSELANPKAGNPLVFATATFALVSVLVVIDAWKQVARHVYVVFATIFTHIVMLLSMLVALGNAAAI